MLNQELDHEIIQIKEAIEELIDSKDFAALEIAQADLNYFISLLNK